MAFTASTAFEARITNNEFNDLCNIAGKYYVSTTPTDCDAGLLCVRSERLPVEGFASTVLNENTWKMVAAPSATMANEPIYACNTYDTQLLAGVGANKYFVGAETLGLGVPAGRYGNFTKIDFHGDALYRFGVGNFSGAVGTNEYATIEAGKLIPAASAPASAGYPYFKIMGSGAFTVGTTTGFAYYDLLACES